MAALIARAARIVLALAAVAPAAAPAAAQFCPPYPQSTEYRPRTRTVPADPSNWVDRIQDAQNGDDVLLADGVYPLDQYAVVIDRTITVRSASGNRDAVRIVGQGYGPGAEALMVLAANVTIADLTVTAVRNHAIAIKNAAHAPIVYNVHLYDVGTQHLKGSGVTSGGVVACSRIGYTAQGVQGDYINGIDIHGAQGYVIRDNTLYNIWGDGSGCEVDIDCGTYQPGGGPAILLWNSARDNVLVRNRILDSYRGIALGLGSTYSGGEARNNFFFQSTAGRNGPFGFIPGDAGISLEGASNVLVDHNTIILGGSYPGAIEIRNGSGVSIRNNLLSAPVWHRGNATYNGSCSSDACNDTPFGNKVNGAASDLAGSGDPHLAPASNAVDFPSTLSGIGVPTDIDGEPRPAGARPDAGCDEWRTGGGSLFADGFESGDTSAWG